MYDYFELPNRLHPVVETKDIVLKAFGDCVEQSDSHVELATKLSELEVSSKSDTGFYLLGRLAELELSLVIVGFLFASNPIILVAN